MDGIKKAALFLSGLEWKTVDTLLGRLEPEQARALRREMMSLEFQSVSSQDTNRLASEFLHAAGNKTRRAGGSARHAVIEHQLAAPPTTYGPPPRKNSTPRFVETDFQPQDWTEKKLKQKPFEFFHNSSAAEIVQEMAQEHPQTIAMVVAHLPASQARAVLEEMPGVLQKDLARRLAAFDVPDEEVLHDIETSIRERFEERLREKQRRAAVRQVLGELRVEK